MYNLTALPVIIATVRTENRAARHTRTRSEWLTASSSSLEVYVRVGRKYDMEVQKDVLFVTLANLRFRDSDDEGKGYFREFMIYLEQNAIEGECDAIYVENILNPRLAAILRANGYFDQKGTDNFAPTMVKRIDRASTDHPVVAWLPQGRHPAPRRQGMSSYEGLCPDCQQVECDEACIWNARWEAVECCPQCTSPIPGKHYDEACTAPPSAPVGVAYAWQEGYRQGVLDERTSEANIGVAGFNAKIEPARVNPYLAQQPTPSAPVGVEGLPQPFGYVEPRHDLSGYEVFDEPSPRRAAIWNMHGMRKALAKTRAPYSIDADPDGIRARALTQQPAVTPVGVEFKRCPDDGSLVSEQGHRLAYGGVPGCWRVKPEDFPPEALAQQPAVTPVGVDEAAEDAVAIDKAWDRFTAALAQPPAEGRECKCDMRAHMVGYGCDVCNPEYADDTAEAQAQGGGEGFDAWFDEYSKQNYTDDMLARAAWDAALAQSQGAGPK